MISNKEIKVDNAKWDRCTRNGIVNIGNKRAYCHTFSPLITSNDELTSYFENVILNPSELRLTKMLVFRLIDAENTIEPILQRIHQRTLYNTSTSEKDIVESTPIVIDPSLDYTWYSRYTEVLSKDQRIPKEIRRLAEKLLKIDTEKEAGKIDRSEAFHQRKRTYEAFWLDLVKDPKKLVDVVTQMLNVQHALGADIGLPPVPVIYSPELFEVAKKINNIAQAVWAGENCATYLILSPECMKMEVFLKQIMEYLKTVKSKVVVLKIKNLELDKVSYVFQRRMFKEMLESINHIKHSSNDEKVFMMLEAGYQMYPALAGGFDFVSTTLRALDKDQGGFGANDAKGFGGWFDPKYLVVRPIRDVRKMLENGNGLPCGCEICRNIAVINNKDDWNRLRRLHYLYTVARFCEELNQYVTSQRMELSVEKLSQSALSNFKKMLPFVS